MDVMQDACRIQWTIFTNATTEKATRKVAERLLNLLDSPAEHVEFALYTKTGGWTFSFQSLLSGATHNDIVVEAIALGQRVGYAWTLTGDVLTDPEGWSNEARVSGVTSLHWQFLHEGETAALGADDADH